VDNITKLLKGFVIVGGVALIAGTVLLIVMIMMRASGDPAAEPEVAATAGAVADRCTGGAPASQAVSVPLPSGARIEQIVPDGNCLILLGVGGDGRQFVALVDPLTGDRISLLVIRPEP
jgi:hypothetical protein